ncbi:MAG: response regulator [Methylococcaceae bacterium]|nr:response regulator [Methylococcaceae bacterium]
MNPVPTVFIVDDDSAVRSGLNRLLRSAGYQTATFASAGEFLDHLEDDGPGCLVLDMQLPDCNGLDLQQTLNRRGRLLPIVFLTGHGDIPMSVRAMKAGAVDFLTKPCQDDILLAAIDAALSRGQQMRQTRSDLAEFRSRLATLTRRERQVLDLVVAGRLNKQIAAELGTCEQTIKVHRMRLKEKLCIKSLADLVRWVEKTTGSASCISQ